MKAQTELGKLLLALAWLPIAFVAYCIAFGAGMVKTAAKDGWEEFP